MTENKDKKPMIRIRGANENNLKNISLNIPRNELVVLTGLSGSGKSSLAFDTIYAEGQTVYGVPLLLRTAIFGANGKTGRGKHRGAPSRDFYRSEIYKPQPQVYRRNRDGNLRLFPSALCQSRNPPLPKMRKRN